MTLEERSKMRILELRIDRLASKLMDSGVDIGPPITVHSEASQEGNLEADLQEIFQATSVCKRDAMHAMCLGNGYVGNAIQIIRGTK